MVSTSFVKFRLNVCFMSPFKVLQLLCVAFANADDLRKSSFVLLSYIMSVIFKAQTKSNKCQVAFFKMTVDSLSATNLTSTNEF